MIEQKYRSPRTVARNLLLSSFLLMPPIAAGGITGYKTLEAQQAPKPLSGNLCAEEGQTATLSGRIGNQEGLIRKGNEKTTIHRWYNQDGSPSGYVAENPVNPTALATTEGLGVLPPTEDQNTFPITVSGTVLELGNLSNTCVISPNAPAK